MVKKKRTKSTVKKLKKNPKKANKKMVSKTKKVIAIPKDYHTITTYIIVHNAKKAIDFYKNAFLAKENMRLEHKGKIMHAELKIGDSKIMLADECHEMDAKSPKNYGGSPVSMHVYVKKVDDFIKKAINHGATIIKPIEDMFWGDRAGMIEDPFGHRWFIATHVENVSPKEIKKRADKLFN